MFCVVSEYVLTDAIEDQLNPSGPYIVPVSHCQCSVIGVCLDLIPPASRDEYALTFAHVNSQHIYWRVVVHSRVFVYEISQVLPRDMLRFPVLHHVLLPWCHEQGLIDRDKVVSHLALSHASVLGLLAPLRAHDEAFVTVLI